MELVRMTVVTSDGHHMYGSLVSPESHIILVGDGLENDRVLRIIHSNLIDTHLIFPHSNGLQYCRSLKSLESYFLERDIQQDSSGHCSFDDARACMELMLWRIRTEFDVFQSVVPFFFFCSSSFYI
jgi:RNA exonuclease 1